MLRNKIIVFLFILFACFFKTFGQDVLFKSPLYVYVKKQAKYYLTTDPNSDEALFWSKIGIANAIQNNNIKHQSTFYSYSAVAYSSKQNYDSAVFYNKKTVELKEKLNDTKGLAISCFNLANCYRELGKYEDAERLYIRAFWLNISIRRQKGIISSYNGYAVIQKVKGDYIKAIDIYQKALILSIEKEEDYIQANILNNLGTCHEKLGNYKKSEQYYLEALDIYSEKNSISQIVNTKINIAQLISKTDKNEALVKYTEALDIANENNLKKQKAIILNNISSIYIHQNKFLEAYKYSIESYQINKEIDRVTGLISSMQNIAITLANLNRTSEGEKILNEALEICETKKLYPSILQIYSSYERFYFIQKNYSKAYYFKNQYDILKDSLQNEEILKTISELNIKYQTAEKEKEIKTHLLTIENKNNQIKHEKRITTIIIITLIIVLIFSLFLLRLFFQKNKAYKILVKQQVDAIEKELKTKQKSKDKYESSQLSDNERLRLIADLKNVISKDEIFTDNSLTIDVLAEKLNTNRRYLSELTLKKRGFTEA